MTPSEQTKMAQMVDGYETEIRETKSKLKAACKVIDNDIPELEDKNKNLHKALCSIYELWTEANFKSKTCPEAHLQSLIRKIRDIAMDAIQN